MFTLLFVVLRFLLINMLLNHLKQNIMSAYKIYAVMLTKLNCTEINSKRQCAY